MSSSGSSVYDCGVKLCVLPTFTPPTFFFCLFFFHLFIFICTFSLWKKEGPSIFKRCLVSKLVYSSGYVKVMSIGKVSFVLLLFCVRSFLMHLSTQISSFQTLFNSSPSSSSSPHPPPPLPPFSPSFPSPSPSLFLLLCLPQHVTFPIPNFLNDLEKDLALKLILDP